MWRACGNDDNVALFKFMVHTALYSRARYTRTIFARDLKSTCSPIGTASPAVWSLAASEGLAMAMMAP